MFFKRSYRERVRKQTITLPWSARTENMKKSDPATREQLLLSKGA
jgi:hypothetical protein